MRYKTQNDDKRNKKHNTENYKDQQHGLQHGRHQHEHQHGRHQHQHLGWPLVLAKGNELLLILKIVWRNQRGNQNPYIQEEQTTQWSIEKAQKDKQRSTKHTHKTKDRVTRTH